MNQNDHLMKFVTLSLGCLVALVEEVARLVDLVFGPTCLVLVVPTHQAEG